jgi:hypothetical protein
VDELLQDSNIVFGMVLSEVHGGLKLEQVEATLLA